MSLLRFLRGGPLIQPVRSGSLLVPRGIADRAVVQWPKCLRCGRIVSAYGYDNETDRTVEVWVRCDGQEPGGERVHAPRRAGVTIDKRSYPGGWTENTRVDVLRRVALEPGGVGRWRIRLGNPDVVEPS